MFVFTYLYGQLSDPLVRPNPACTFIMTTNSMKIPGMHMILSFGEGIKNILSTFVNAEILTQYGSACFDKT